MQQTVPVTLKQLSAMLKACRADDNDWVGRRDVALIETLYSTGCRVAELCSLNRHDVVKDTIRIVGKGGKYRSVFLGGPARRALKRWEAVRDDHKPALFINSSDHHRVRRLTPQGVNLILKKRWRDARLDKGNVRPVHPHAFRHAFATHMLEEGANLAIIQALMGHSNIAATQIYTHPSPELLSKAHKRFHPRG